MLHKIAVYFPPFFFLVLPSTLYITHASRCYQHFHLLVIISSYDTAYLRPIQLYKMIYTDRGSCLVLSFSCLALYFVCNLHESRCMNSHWQFILNSLPFQVGHEMKLFVLFTHKAVMHRAHFSCMKCACQNCIFSFPSKCWEHFSSMLTTCPQTSHSYFVTMTQNIHNKYIPSYLWKVSSISVTPQCA